jgi:hypothetical protein
VSTLIAGDILKATVVVQGLQGQVGLPSIHYLVGITAGAPQDTDLATAIDALVTADFLPCLANSAKYLGTISQIIWPLPIQARKVVITAAANGTGGAQTESQQASPILSFETKFAGPAQRGRFYIPFMPGGVVNTTTGELTNLYRAVAQTWGNSLLGITSIGSGGNLAAVNAVIYHRETHTTDFIESVLARFAIGTQKRRGNYGKQNVSPI